MNSVRKYFFGTTPTLSTISERYDKALNLAKTIKELPKFEALNTSTWRLSRPSASTLQAKLNRIKTDLESLSNDTSDPINRAKIAVQISELQSLISRDPTLKVESVANTVFSKIGLGKPIPSTSVILENAADTAQSNLFPRHVRDYYESLIPQDADKSKDTFLNNSSNITTKEWIDRTTALNLALKTLSEKSPKTTYEEFLQELEKASSSQIQKIMSTEDKAKRILGKETVPGFENKRTGILESSLKKASDYRNMTHLIRKSESTENASQTPIKSSFFLLRSTNPIESIPKDAIPNAIDEILDSLKEIPDLTLRNAIWELFNKYTRETDTPKKISENISKALTNLFTKKLDELKITSKKDPILESFKNESLPLKDKMQILYNASRLLDSLQDVTNYSILFNWSKFRETIQKESSNQNLAEIVKNKANELREAFKIDKFEKLGYQEKTIQDLLKEIDSVGIPIITENLNWVNLINNTNKLQIKSLSITNTKQVISHLTKYAPSDIVTLYKKIDKKILHMQSKRESINSDSIIKTANIVIEEWNKSHPGETDIPNIQISI